MDPREQEAAPWRTAGKRSILDRVRGTDHLSAKPAHATPGIDEDRSDRPGWGQEIRTFLFADVRGYTAFTHERGDEAAAALAARFADVVRREVETEGGSLVELRGDEALVVFGSPRLAIRKAIDLQRRFLDETRSTPDVPLAVGIGLDVGEAIQVGAGYRGGVLNLAARLCSEAGPGEILATQSLVHVARRLEGVRYVDRGELHLKGLADPVHALNIVAEDIDVAEQIRALLPRRLDRRVYGGKLQFRVLGPLEVDASAGPINLGGPKQRAVLAHLLIRANELVPSETLIDEVWGDDPPDKVRNIVQTYISHLRKALGPDRIRSQAPGYRLRLEPSELDAARFDGLVRDAKKALLEDPNLAVGMLEDALSLWRGPALADLADHPSFVAEATRLDDQRLEAQEDRVEGLLASGAHTRAIRELEGLIGRHPLRERLWSMLMLALYREGRQGEALQAFQRAREVLADELGIDPSPELARLHERILKQDPSLDVRGEPLRGYRLLEKIGQGRTGVVFRAIQPHVGRDVAVKVFHEQVAADPSFVRRFEPDAQAVAALEHPHIAPVHDYWREPGRAYVVTRYLRGGSLRALEQRGASLEGDRALRMLEQVASALAFAHRQGVAHGDVGPSNLLFDAEGHAYLADFRIGVGGETDPAHDVRELAALVKRWAPKGSSAAEVAERAEVGSERLEADAFADAARAALEPGAPVGPRRGDDRNPYKGLRPFTEADARDFFGRGEMIHRLVARLDGMGPGSKFLAIVGPSGAGKSSVVRAGVVPAIRHGALGDADATFVAEMFPGQHPLEELEAALLRIAVRPGARLQGALESGSRGLLEAVEVVAPEDASVVLVVDQFEELFTQTTDERERELFLESLRVATADPDSRLRVIVTLRADFYDRPLVYPRFGELLAARTEAVPPLTPDELEQAIRGPAEQVGVRPERGLVAEMIADVAHQPGALPLLQYALTELFEQREDGRLTLDAYERMGRVGGALSAAADRLFESTDADGRRAIRQVFLRLVTLGEGRQDTRRRVGRSELDALDVGQDAIDGVLEPFGRHRLLTFDREPTTREPAVEIAHEALLTEWSRLRIWIDDAREDLRHEQGLGRAETEWRASAMDPSFLLRGTRLEQLETWAATTDLAIGRPERLYLQASVERGERERAEEQARRDRERLNEQRSRGRLRALVAVLTVAALVAGTLTVVATRQSERAEREATEAKAREFAAAAVADLEVDPERSILLALQAVAQTRSADGSVLLEAEEALHRAVTASRVIDTVEGVGGELAWSPKGVFASEALDRPGTFEIWDTESGTIVRSIDGHRGDINDFAFSPDGSTLATAADDGRVTIWDASTWKPSTSLRGRGDALGPSFSADGTIVAAAIGGTVQVLDLSNGRVVFSRPVKEPLATSLSPDGRSVAVVMRFREGAVFDVRTEDRSFDLTGRGGDPTEDRGISWSPDGRYIATTGADGTPRVWDASTGALLSTLVGHSGFAVSISWASDSSHLVTGGTDGTAKIWEIGDDSVAPLHSLTSREMQTGVWGVAFSSDGMRVMAGGTAVKVWDVGPNGDAEWANLPWSGPSKPLVRFMPDGRDIATTNGAGVMLRDLLAGRQTPTMTSSAIGGVHAIDVSPQGDAVAAGGSSLDEDRFGGQVVQVWDPTTGRRLLSVPHDLDALDVAFSRDGAYLVTASFDGTSKIVDREGRVVRVLIDPDPFDPRTGEGNFIGRARFSPDGSLVATAPWTMQPGGELVRIWDWRRGTVLRTIPHASLPEFDPRGSRIVTVTESGRGEIRDLGSFDVVARLDGQLGGVQEIAFSPDGSTLASAGSDGVIRLFDPLTGNERLTLPGRGCEVTDIAFSPDGTRLASASGCDGIRIWALDIGDLIEIARRQVTRPLTDEECDQYLHEPCADVAAT
jgi:WD40 repeat protein/DNA-binding SARP family transcriptional activator/class 3 adenylate cyclase